MSGESMWRLVVDPDTGREYLVPEGSLWERISEEVNGDDVEFLLRRCSTGETLVVMATKEPA